MKYKPNNKDELKQLISIKTIRLDDIDTSLITDMSELFMESKMIDCMGFEVFKSNARKDFSGIDSWDVSKVTNMRCMFYKATSFNQPLDSWDLSNIIGTSYVFRKMFDEAKKSQTKPKWYK